MRNLRHSLLLPASLAILGFAGPAKAGLPDRLDQALQSGQEAADELAAAAREAIIVGGAFLYENRHTVAGTVLGCAAGSALGASSAAALAPVTGGAALTAAGYAALLGCGTGAVVGGQIGYPLDHVFDQE